MRIISHRTGNSLTSRSDNDHDSGHHPRNSLWGSVDVPLETTYITNDFQLALGRIRGTAIIDTAYTDRIDEDKHWHYQFLVDATNQRVVLERLELFDGADSGAFTDREVLDTEGVERGVVVEEYERTLAQLLRRTTETDSGGLTTTRGDGA